MGCWGMGIMQSDSAIDAEIEILETAGLNWDTKSFSKVKSAFSNKFKAIEELCNQYQEDSFYKAVSWQVFIFLTMKNGVEFNQEQQEKMIIGATSCEEYKWGKRYSNKEDLKQNYKEYFIKEFGEKDWENNSKLWGLAQ